MKYTVNKELKVVEATSVGCNPTSSDKNALELFVKNYQYELDEYFNSDDNYGIAFYACGYNGTAQDEFIQSWKEVGVEVF